MKVGCIYRLDVYNDWMHIKVGCIYRLDVYMWKWKGRHSLHCVYNDIH